MSEERADGNSATRRFDDLLDRAILLPAEARATFLRRECNDEALRAQLDRFLADAADSSFGEARPIAATCPERVGPYVIARPLGRGGMGDVFLAHREGPVQRDVALKVIRAGMDTTEVLRRFERERQALASLDHPHVAKVFDAGVDAAGRPYFAMEYVPGESIVAYCEQRKLAVRTRLRLFVQACAAVEHAHHKGVIHRDIKPSNLLVSASGGCKVIDFGIAKAVSEEHADQTLLTVRGQFLGTPEYMSPEQASSSADADTRTDVYSLGAVLYELLAGQRPLGSELRGATNLTEILRVLAEDEPRRPSDLRPRLSPDLDWICLRALHKDRERRYRSPAELAADVERFLAFDPVVARPPSASYRLQRFVRRNRSLVAAATASVVALAVGLGFTTSSYVTAASAWQRQKRVNDDLLRMADLHLLRDAERAAEALWPATPDRVRDLQRWLADYATPLQERRNLHTARLAELRRRAIPQSEEDRAHDRATHPHALDLELATFNLRALATEAGRARYPNWEPGRQLFADAVAELEAKVISRRTWRFDDAATQWEHDTLAQLVADADRFFDSDPHEGVVGSVTHRLGEIARLEVANGTDDARTLWAQAIAEVRADPRYGGLDLEPQIGLVPLSRNAQGLWEFWHVPTGTRPEASVDPQAPSRWLVTEETGLVLILIPGGTYRIGAQGERPAAPHFDPRAAADEALHEVDLWPFFLAKYELTFAQWRRLTGQRPYGTLGPLEPVGNVTWRECAQLVARLGLTLPTEAQWEAATRAGTTTPWWCGEHERDLQGCANVADARTAQGFARLPLAFTRSLDDGCFKLAPVGRFRANAFGLHDVAGNVYEWCLDPYVAVGFVVRGGDGLRSAREAVSATPDLACRGGGWQRPAENARSAEREHFEPDTQLTYLGLRPARRLDRDRAALPAPSYSPPGEVR